MAVSEVQLVLSVGLIEKDRSGDVLWVWCFPSVSSELRTLLLRKCPLSADGKIRDPFIFGQHRRVWYYITSGDITIPGVLPKVRQYSLVLTSKDFNPEKYAALSRILSRLYCKYGSPASMMEAYLSVVTKGLCQTEENGSFLVQDYQAKKTYLAGSIKGYCQLWFGTDKTGPFSTHVFTCRKMSYKLLKCVQGMWQGFWRRRLRTGQNYLMFSSIFQRLRYWWNNMPEEIAQKTAELLAHLTSLAAPTDEGGKPRITMEALRERRFPPATENFLFHLAASEQMLKL
ncbi:DENN domain-containing protein 10 isoform X2 [Petromyzon marinus]|uniref:DENN domain-containing protein 10 isoform X2 n=1 Tax=Petromyzon marinus TaxID=7757 RepID=UPI003F7077AD